MKMRASAIALAALAALSATGADASGCSTGCNTMSTSGCSSGGGDGAPEACEAHWWTPDTLDNTPKIAYGKFVHMIVTIQCTDEPRVYNATVTLQHEDPGGAGWTTPAANDPGSTQLAPYPTSRTLRTVAPCRPGDWQAVFASNVVSRGGIHTPTSATSGILTIGPGDCK